MHTSLVICHCVLWRPTTHRPWPRPWASRPRPHFGLEMGLVTKTESSPHHWL